jgi:3-deoxy-D-manno-octulosonate 8-phosphate phosphatase (KDO 8-P phosphatase)
MDLEEIFVKLGGTFITPSVEIASCLANIRVFIFDWDGVFNNGSKTGDTGSPFSEIDSMGINLLRFSFWLKTGQMLNTFIITGMNNQAALGFARREHFNGIFMNQKNKKLALNAICESQNIRPDQAAFIFDDIIDLAVAKECGLSFYVNRTCNPLLSTYIKENRIASYITAHSGNNNAIREICELLIGLNGNYNTSVEMRSRYSDEYNEYFETRNKIETRTDLA